MSGNSWAGKHKKELLALAAVGGLGAATGGFGLLGGAGTAGGLLGAEAGAGAAAGGLAGADAVGAGAGLLSLEAGAGAAAGGLAGADAVGAGAGTMGPMDTWLANGGVGKLGSGLGRGAQLAQMAGGQQRPPPMPPMQAPGMVTPPGASAPPFAQLFPVDVIDDEKRRRLMAQMQRGGYA